MLKKALLVVGTLSLSGCQSIVLSPIGDIALQQRDIILTATWLMLLVVVPVILLTLFFAWRYRASNRTARYEPEWSHSTLLELLIWSVPLVIIIALGALTWVMTHRLDPYRPLDRVSEGRPVPPAQKPLVIQAIALDWKWLFVYPELGIAVVNEVAAPVDRPIEFRITSTTVMNSLSIPALAGQIYAMPHMQTTLHAIANAPGSYEGFSGNYSGAGFSQMRFRFLGLNHAGFDRWVAQAKATSAALDRPTYLSLAQPSIGAPVQRFGAVMPNLFDAVLMPREAAGALCVETPSGQQPAPKPGAATASRVATRG
ncbi:ubiquinol oxidase subunit II [Burkholderia alba]|uniref:ubiquinol oxidase subunit II n=1 Tax=Burkholderia alba TaxID=2683677 RepID=UPI002B05CBB0|nr:ubiquinol oxidase subunit II [Burkholderia alba]